MDDFCGVHYCSVDGAPYYYGVADICFLVLKCKVFMISYLKGTILNKTHDMITICVHDAIGYEIWMTPQEIQKLAIGDKKEVFCYHHISDRTQELYGFRTREQRELFALLISHVNGVGPKLALKLLTKIDSDITQKAAAQGDALILEQ